MKIVASIFLALLSFCVNAQDMQKYLNDTRDLVKQGNFKEALKRDIWFHDHALQYSRAMSGVRLSFALGDWKTLGDKYPPALAALIKVRDDKTKLVEANGGPSNLFQDVAAINRTLKEDAKTIALFKGVIKAHPDSAQHNWHYVKRLLFDAKEYTLIHKYIRTPFYEFTILRESYNSSVSYYPKMGIGQPSVKRITEENFIKGVTQLIQYSRAVNDTRSAKDIQQQADLIINDGRIETALKG
ncbi:MAG: hypothetical protein V4560_01395 [Bacteroidota bacterium]